ncbi:hypothetical protein EMIHUDRAFT_421614, partial [Emiliania huxleyi CCMP1516]|uniref:Uncharacterized protein n=2 Tax=Emiliania huxleyi TaxID=2903 RepID=A0A0D3JAF5_EMIH1
MRVCAEIPTRRVRCGPAPAAARAPCPWGPPPPCRPQRDTPRQNNLNITSSGVRRRQRSVPAEGGSPDEDRPPPGPLARPRERGVADLATGVDLRVAAEAADGAAALDVAAYVHLEDFELILRPPLLIVLLLLLAAALAAL